MRPLKLYLQLFLAILIASCSKYPSADPNNRENATSSEVIPVEEAINMLESFLQGPSRANNLIKIADIHICGNNARTRSSAYELPDTVAYIINFENEEGFAILGAQRNLTPIYAVTESGDINATDFNLILNKKFDQIIQTSIACHALSSESSTQEIGIDIVPHLIASAVISDLLIRNPDIIHYEIAPKVNVGPHVTTKWNQCYPFNSFCPDQTQEYNKNTFRGKCPVGCVMVAVGQILACNRQPAKASAYDQSYDWNDLTTISNYENWEKFRPLSYDNYKAEYASNCDKLARFLAYLGSAECCNAYYKDNATGSTITQAKATFKKYEPIFYKDIATIKFEDGKTRMYKMLDEGKPLYIRASDKNAGGHAWVIDGYRIYERRYSNPTRLGISYFTDKYLHCNFGWQGNADGYYYEGIFQQGSRFKTDPTIDDPNSSDLFYNFDTEITLLTY